MVASVRSTTTTDVARSSTSIVVGKPAGAVEGDILLVDITVNNLSTPNSFANWSHTDFVLVVDQVGVDGSTNQWNRVSRFKRTLTASEPASWTFTVGAGESIDDSQASCVCVQGGSSVGATASNETTAGTTWTSGSVTTTAANSLVVRIWAHDATVSIGTGDNNVSGYTAGLTEHVDVGNHGAFAGGWTSTALTSEVQAATGATGSKTATVVASTGLIWIATEIIAGSTTAATYKMDQEELLALIGSMAEERPSWNELTDVRAWF